MIHVIYIKTCKSLQPITVSELEPWFIALILNCRTYSLSFQQHCNNILTERLSSDSEVMRMRSKRNEQKSELHTHRANPSQSDTDEHFPSAWGWA